MEAQKENLMKHFASVLRGRALGKLKAPGIDIGIVRYFSRRELIEIVKKRFDGAVPKQYDLAELENEELLPLIGDEMFIISFVTEKWSRELSEQKEVQNPVPKSGPTKETTKK